MALHCVATWSTVTAEPPRWIGQTGSLKGKRSSIAQLHCAFAGLLCSVCFSDFGWFREQMCVFLYFLLSFYVFIDVLLEQEHKKTVVPSLTKWLHNGVWAVGCKLGVWGKIALDYLLSKYRASRNKRSMAWGKQNIKIRRAFTRQSSSAAEFLLLISSKIHH